MPAPSRCARLAAGCGRRWKCRSKTGAPHSSASSRASVGSSATAATVSRNSRRFMTRPPGAKSPPPVYEQDECAGDTDRQTDTQARDALAPQSVVDEQFALIDVNRSPQDLGIEQIHPGER